MKKTVKILLMITVILSILALTSCFGLGGESKDLAFELNEDGKSYSVVGIGGCTDRYITIPNEYDGLPVTKIGCSAFSNQNIVGVKFSKNIEHIDAFAFNNCAYLKFLNFAEDGNLKIIGDYAFYWPSFWLWDIQIPEGVTHIGEHAFDRAWPIRLSLPNSLEEVGAGAFVGMSSAYGSHKAYYFDFLQPYNTYDNAVYLGNDSNPYLLLCSMNDYSYRCQINTQTKIIADGALGGYLTKISIPASVKQTSGAFRRCYSLEEITVDDRNTVYKSIDGNLYSKNGDCFLQYTAGKKDKTFVLPDTVKAIEYYAFSGAQSLKTVFIPDSVELVGSNVFSGCSSDLLVYCEAKAQPVGWSEKWNGSVKVIWGYKV